MPTKGNQTRSELALDFLISKAFLDLYNLIDYKEIPKCNIEKAKRIITEAERLIERFSKKYVKTYDFNYYYDCLDEKTSFIYSEPGESLDDIRNKVIKKLRGQLLQKSLLAIKIQRLIKMYKCM